MKIRQTHLQVTLPVEIDLVMYTNAPIVSVQGAGLYGWVAESESSGGMPSAIVDAVRAAVDWSETK